MASTKWTRRNVNRYKKVYPFVQRTPRYKFESDKESILEVAEIRFNGEIEKQYVFHENYLTVPIVTAAPYDDVTGQDAQVSIMLKDLSRTAVTIQPSQAFIGGVHIHIIWVDPTAR